jgi:RimJ/RimL family protein N-acetyltransferase
VQVQASGRAPADGVVVLRATDAGARRDAGPWLLSGAARRGEAMWFEVRDALRDESVGVAVLVRRAGAAVAEVGYAPGAGAGARGFAGAALYVVARRAFGELGLARLETRTRERDDLLVATLRGIGFTCVGRDRDKRFVWSLVPRELR